MTVSNDPLVNNLVHKRDDLVVKIESFKTTAIESGRDLTDEELESIETYKRSIADIDRQLDVVATDVRMDEEARAKLSTLNMAPQPHYRDAGQIVWDLIHQGDPDAASRMRTAKKRAAEHMGTLAADTTPTAGDVAALYVDPIVGPVIRPNNAMMPFTAALGQRQMPPGSAFERPFIVDDAFDTGVAAQTAQKAELASKKFDADSTVLKRTSIGGYLNVSQQMIQWQPGALDVVVAQMRDRLSAAVERFNIAELANSTGTEDLPAGSDGATTLAAFYNAAAAVYNTTNELATWALMGPLGWARLGSITDLGGRPLLPSLGPVNAAGQMRADTFQSTGVAGLQTVVTPAITDDSFWVGNGSCIEAYSYYYPLMESMEPSVLGRQIAVAGDFVAYRPTPYANGAVHIFDATP